MPRDQIDTGPQEAEMTFLEHLDELRRRIMYSVISILATFVLGWIFREQIWSERLLESPAVNFSQFYVELEEIISQSSFQSKGLAEEAVFCAGCTEARGLNFQAAAVLGLAEGEFPGTIRETCTSLIIRII